MIDGYCEGHVGGQAGPMDLATEPPATEEHPTDAEASNDASNGRGVSNDRVNALAAQLQAGLAHHDVGMTSTQLTTVPHALMAERSRYIPPTFVCVR